MATDPERAKIAAQQAKIYKEIQSLIKNVYNQAISLPQIKKIMTSGEMFRLRENPAVERAINHMLTTVRKQVGSLILGGVEEAWKEGENQVWRDASVYLVRSEAEQNIFNQVRAEATASVRQDAARAFFNERRDGLKVSDRIWKATEGIKTEMEAMIQQAMIEGKDADQLARELQKFLKDPERIFRRVRNPETKKLELSEAAKKFKPGTGRYRSSYKNALRLASTEISRAYRQATWESYQNNPLIIGYEIQLSNNHTCSDGKGGIIPGWTDICDVLQGRYPKVFRWLGWHPHCYSDDTEVMTERGWKLFRDLLPEDRIMSLNPETRMPEYVRFVNSFNYAFDGDMIRYSNRSLDMLVTPDHRMVYLDKNNGKIRTDKLAVDYSKFNGGLYRSSEYQADDTPAITIGNTTLPFDLYAQFMAYYLSDGSLFWTRQNQLKITQIKDKSPEVYDEIASLLDKLPFKHTPMKEGFYISSPELYEYLKQFGKCTDKHVPEEIKQASRRQIEIFLSAYVSCDGYTRKNKPFVGNRGTLCSSNRSERNYSTSSNQMSSDLGELILKMGRRPSFSLVKVKGVAQQHRNGVYVCNADVWSIRECYSETATVFNKSYVPYSGRVYDIELERNHIMYVRRNGRCVWGSNCRCRMIAIMISREEWAERVKARAEDKLDEWQPKNPVTEMPEAFNKWIKDNTKRIDAGRHTPYWIQDNFKGGRISSGLKEGIVSGSGAGAVDPEVELYRKIESMEDKIRKNRSFETGIIFEDDGTIVLERKGQKRRVSFTEEELELSKDKIFTHNHPSGWYAKEGSFGRIGSSFSAPDVLLAIKYDIKEMRAVTPLIRFSMKRPADGWPSLSDAKMEYNRLNMEISQENYSRIESGTLTRGQASSTHYHEIWKRFAKRFGIEYTKKQAGLPG